MDFQYPVTTTGIFQLGAACGPSDMVFIVPCLSGKVPDNFQLQAAGLLHDRSIGKIKELVCP